MNKSKKIVKNTGCARPEVRTQRSKCTHVIKQIDGIITCLNCNFKSISYLTPLKKP